jgi:uncharacterized membrane protein
MGRSQTDVVVTALIAALAGWAAVSGAPAAVTAVLGIALFAAPGYLLGQLLVGSRTAGLERVAVMAGLALAVPILGGLLLYAAGVPLKRPGWLGLLAGVTLAGDVALLLRRGGTGRRSAASVTGSSASRLPRGHTAVFAAAVLVAAGAVVVARIGVTIQPKPGFTQLWLAPDRHGDRAESLGVTNDQGSTTSYRLVLARDNHVSATWNLTLADGRTWQRSVPFTGSGTLTARLYRLPDLTHPYRYVSTGTPKAAGS